MMELGRYLNIAFAAPEAIREIQEMKLRQHVGYCIESSPYYRRAFEGAGIDYKTLRLDQLPQLPFTEKSDVEQHNDEFCAVSSERIADIVFSSGTTGRSTRIVYTDYDLHRLAYNEEKAFAGCGIGPGDVVLLTCTLDRCFIAGLAYYLGVRGLGATAVRSGLGSLESQAELFRQCHPTAIVGVPSFLRKLGLHMQEQGLDPGRSHVSKLICIGESLRDRNLALLKVGEDLQDLWQAELFSTYASSEIVTSFCECTAHQGGHLHPDLAIVEVVDENGVVLPPGKSGEVVVTPMAVEGMPLIRYKTGDMSFLIDQPCSCGRFSVRLGPILGRTKHMMKVRGTTLYPQALYSVLEEIKAISDYYIVATSAADLSSEITVYAAVSDPSCTADIIQDKLQARLRVKPAVILTEREIIRQHVDNPKSRKPVFFIDRRATR
jgi:phenylacetate-CoA ligase